ncbi:hypothetical protein FKG94_23995 [Exilibacterium tricleocarpae]|uniref:Sel1 repeat family protein n=1 Tax=Exilibacterium tricleocarpae TaxID=2591008 RepID=A0A545ST68_9GAMM|nr:hypothetical protein [Exilibacterium tricleocarpae]TQV68156.1 hypothetical protein FKG94_23995 [Exilibacterium tricleocarpae]
MVENNKKTIASTIIQAIAIALMVWIAPSMADSDEVPVEGELQPSADSIRDDPESALTLARRLFYNADRTAADVQQARHYFMSAKDFIEPSHLRVCEFWLMHAAQNFKRAEKHCLRAMQEDEYYPLLALAYIYEQGPEGIRNVAHAYGFFMLAERFKQGDLYSLARAGKKRVGRELGHARRREIDSKAGTGWSLF